MSQLSIAMMLQRRCRRGGVLRIPVGALGRQLPLRREALQVAHQPQPQRVLYVQTLAADQIPRHLRRALAESYAVVVHCISLGVVRDRVETWNHGKYLYTF